MVPTSTIPAFRAAMIATLEARAGLAGVKVCDGPPPPGVLQSEKWIALLEVRGRQSIRAMAPRQPREEKFTQIVQLAVKRQTRSDQVTIGNEAFAIQAEIEDAIRTDTTLAATYDGPGSLYSVVLGQETYETFADDSTRESRITVGLDVHARL